MAKELFISYGREPEVSHFVTQLKHDLQTNGFSVWLDTEDIPAGCDWHAAIGTGLDQCKALIAVISTKYITSRYCMSELYTANSDKKIIFPVIVEDVDFSTTERARGVKYVISGINWTMFRQGYDDYHTSLSKLIVGMKEQGLGPSGSTDSEVNDLPDKMAHLHVTPSAPPLSSPISNPGYSAPYPAIPSPGHPNYQQTTPLTPNYTPPYPHSPSNLGYHHTTPPAPYTTPPHPSQYPYPYPHFSPSPHTQPYNGYYTSPPSGGYNLPVHYPPGQTYPHASGYPGSQPPSVAGGNPLSSPTYRELFPAHDSVDGGEQPVLSTKERPSFKVGMKLEAVDRRFPYFVCVATIMDRNDKEVMVHFDGWGPEYNYWCSRDSVELHPAGWCLKHNWELQQPLNQEWHGWSTYLGVTESDSAEEELFNEGQLAGPESLLFSPGMRVEAKDSADPTNMCVATIKDVRAGKVLVHYDGWGDERDFWCDAGATDIHPPMWSGKNSKKVTPPLGFGGQFKWSAYLAAKEINPAPAHIFTEEQISSDGRRTSVKPTGVSLNGFQVGMKLEAKDRLQPSKICVATIKDIKDGRLLIQFDGYSSRYDYWCKPTSTDIHPVGWCNSNGEQVNPPAETYAGMFDWNTYLMKQGATAAPENLFSKDQRAVVIPQASQFKAGMKLEAKDRRNPSLVCVATITKVENNQLLIHFDGWTSKYDYWCDPTTIDIHPIGWCQRQGHALQPPKGHHGPFDWGHYLSSTPSTAAPTHLFRDDQKATVTSQPSSFSTQFKAGMKLEAKDRQNSSLVCVATITEVKNNQLLIHFDGWTSKYDYWCDPTTTDIHPIGWCQRQGHALQPPKNYQGSFSWDSYLQKNSGSVAAPKTAFSKQQC